MLPADGELLTELKTRLSTRDGSDPFYETLLPLAKTLLVGIAWLERGAAPFPTAVSVGSEFNGRWGREIGQKWAGDLIGEVSIFS
ncbi:MAG UNVERIFIED_CONTAM: hypothetical protein LVR29_17595 [Microcystis novacekii LVE1205-3]|jgi:hypothetical protein